jgi:hypothetical protein
MSGQPGSNIDSTHENIEQLVQKIAQLQKEEESTQKKLLSHEETRNEMCPGDESGGNTQYTHCCSSEDESKTATDDMLLANRLEDYNAATNVTTSLGNKYAKGQTCLFKQNGGDVYSEQLMEQIHSLASQRAMLIKTLMDIYSNVQRDVAETRSDLVDQLTVVGVVEDELGNARTNLDALSGAKNNKNRMALINTYYGKKYQAHTGVMKIVILICVPLLILAIIGKKGYIGANITRPLAIAVTVIGGMFLAHRIWDLSWRNNMNYDEYNWYFDPESVEPTVYQYDTQQFNTGNSISNDLRSLASDLGVECIGPNCCSKGMKYDHKQNMCVEHQQRAADDAKKQSEAFDIMRPVESTSYVSPRGCHSMPSVVRPYDGRDAEQYANIA